MSPKNVLGLVLLLTSAVLTYATTFYNSQTQMCCNGEVHAVDGSSDMSCCDTEAYNYKESLCCYGEQPQVLPLPPGSTSSYGCCENPDTHDYELFDYNSQVCCDGTPMDKPDASKYYGCCNGQLYDYNVQQCCGNEQLIDPATETCCQTYGHNDDGTFGVTAYKVSDALGNNTSCCGIQIYDSSEEICCNDVLVPVPEGSQGTSQGCCGEQIYDFNKQICCQTWDKDDSGNYVATGSAIHNYPDQDQSSQTCCGLDAYNYHESVCCDDQGIIPKPEGSDKNSWMSCCGNQVITNYTSQICYNDVLYQRESYDYYVCDDNLYNTNTQFCCNDVLYDIDSGKQCCYDAQSIYDPTSETCCGNTVEPLTPEDLQGGLDSCCAVTQQYSSIRPAPAGK